MTTRAILCRLVLVLSIPLLLTLAIQQWQLAIKERTQVGTLTRDLGFYRALAASDCVTADKVELLAGSKGWTTTHIDGNRLMVKYSNRTSMADGPDATILTLDPDGCIQP